MFLNVRFDTLHNSGLQSRIFCFLFFAILAGLLGAGVFCKYVDVLGRRQLLMAGCVCMSVAWIGAAIGGTFRGLYCSNHNNLFALDNY